MEGSFEDGTSVAAALFGQGVRGVQALLADEVAVAAALLVALLEDASDFAGASDSDASMVGGRLVHSGPWDAGESFVPYWDAVVLAVAVDVQDSARYPEV